MKVKLLLMSVVFFGVLMASSQLQAALIMTIDPVTKYFWLTGTATGTTSSLGRVIWGNGNNSSEAITGANTSVITTSPSFTVSSIRITHSSGGLGSTFGIFFSGANSQSTTITGEGSAQKVYYGGMPSTSITPFESGIGKTLNNTHGTGFGTLTVVPEPSALSLLGIGLAALAVMRRRRA
ncbi:MAG: PEP-CTERM sorting domain-containing protein [Candidatus Methylacidiphilales bacterium]|jgi:hypothetical protein